MGVLLAPTQTHTQLQRKHEHLQQLIVQQQEELRLVSEQLLISKYGIVPPIVCYPATSSAGPAALVATGSPRHHGGSSNDGIQMHPHPHHQLQSPQPQQMVIQGASSHPHAHYGEMHYMDGQNAIQIVEQQQQQQHHLQLDQQHDPMGNNGVDMMSTYEMPPEMSDPHMRLGTGVVVGGQQHQAMVSGLEMIPYQLTQQQAHVLFGSNMTTNQMNSNPGEG